MHFFVSVVALAAVFAAFMLVERAYRSPSKPKWLDHELTSMMICVALTGAIAGAVGAVIMTALELPLPLWGDAIAAVLVIGGVILLVRIAFLMTKGRGKSAAM
jgi:hypothetical protein